MDTSTLALGLENGSITFWDLNTRQEKISWKAHQESVSVLKQIPYDCKF